MRDRNQYLRRITKEHKIPHENTNWRMCWKTKANDPRIILHWWNVTEGHIITDCKHFIIDPSTKVCNYEAIDVNRKVQILEMCGIEAKNLVRETSEHQLYQEVKETCQRKSCEFVEIINQVMIKVTSKILISLDSGRLSTPSTTRTETIQNVQVRNQP